MTKLSHFLQSFVNLSKNSNYLHSRAQKTQNNKNQSYTRSSEHLHFSNYLCTFLFS